MSTCSWCCRPGDRGDRGQNFGEASRQESGVHFFCKPMLFAHQCFLQGDGPSVRDGLTQRDCLTKRCFYTQVLLHGHVFNGEMFLHTGALEFLGGDDDSDEEEEEEEAKEEDGVVMMVLLRRWCDDGDGNDICW